MAWTQADIDALKAKIKLATESTSYQDRSVKFMPLDDMLKLLEQMEAEVNPTTTGGYSRAIYSRD